MESGEGTLRVFHKGEDKKLISEKGELSGSFCRS
jgi:hypothetical protein